MVHAAPNKVFVVKDIVISQYLVLLEYFLLNCVVRVLCYQESIIASFEDIWQSKLSQNVDTR